jgi:acyl-CoA thioesterase-2
MVPVEDLLRLLDLETLGNDVFRGTAPQDGRRRIFGGQVLGQALVAAERTVSGRDCHSLHAYFLRPGNPAIPIVFEVERSRDGGTFTARRVVAKQDGKIIFTMAASFQVPEVGFEHQTPMPDVPDPETLATDRALRQTKAADLPDYLRAWLTRERPIEIRPVEPIQHFLQKAVDGYRQEKFPPKLVLWLRATGKLPDDPALHRAIIAYASDLSIIASSLLPHGVMLGSKEMQTASLDHALWFHRPVRADEWFLHAQESPSASGGRGFNRGLIYARDGRLVASVCQEGLIRRRDGEASPS